MATSRDDFGIAIRSALLQRGAKQKFSLFVLILISITIFAIDVTQIKPVKILRSLINDSIYRISAISSSPIRFTSATKDFFVKHIFYTLTLLVNFLHNFNLINFEVFLAFQVNSVRQNHLSIFCL